MKMQEEGEDVKIKIEIETKSLNPQIGKLTIVSKIFFQFSGSIK